MHRLRRLSIVLLNSFHEGPQIVLSDSRSPFIANNTQQFVANHNIQWKFSIAEAPWYGGFWERLISQVSDLQTVLSQIELIFKLTTFRCFIWRWFGANSDTKTFVYPITSWVSKSLSQIQEYTTSGDIVNIFEDKQPRQKWLLGRIIELISSKDNFVRAAKIYIGKTKRVIERPTNKLYPVEYND